MLVILTTKYTAQHPEVIKTKSEIEDLKQQIASTKKSPGGTGEDESSTMNPGLMEKIAETEAEIDALKTRSDELLKQQQKAKEVRGGMPKEQEEWTKLQRDRNVYQSIYDDLLKKLENAKVSKDLELTDKVSNFKVVDPAILPFSPIKPNRVALILAGIFHKQIVLIHPFMDGNGRSTRLATKVLLAEMGLNTFNLFSFENYYNNNVTRYFQTVGEFGNYYDIAERIDFTAWLEYFTEGIIDELLRVQKLFPKIPVNQDAKLEDYHMTILDFIRKNGSITNREYAKLIDRAKSTRALDFQKLVEVGLIERKRKGRATYYILKNK